MSSPGLPSPRRGAAIVPLMRFHALATDYDGTLAHEGVTAPEAVEALRQLRKSGRRSIVVTGRLVADLVAAFPDLGLVDAVVAENGAVLYDPATRSSKTLAQPPPAAFVAALREKDVSPLEVGEVIVSTWHPNEEAVLQTIRELGLDLTVIFNKGAVMVLPSNVNKATGLTAQAELFGLSLHNIAGIGDAENDLAFLAGCEASAATANALESVKRACDVVTEHDHGLGVAEFAAQIIADDLAGVASLQKRHVLALGTTQQGEAVSIPVASGDVLLAGTSGAGKTTLVTSLLERLTEQTYGFCVTDPEGDYADLPGTILVGDANAAANLDAIVEIVKANKNPVVSFLALPEADRPAFARRLFARIAEVQAECGRPHRLVIDVAHHVQPAQSQTKNPIATAATTRLFITTRAELVAPAALRGVNVVIAVGDGPARTIESAARILGCIEPPNAVQLERAPAGTAILWKRSDPHKELIVTTVPPTGERRRHTRKYAQGELAPEKSFFFTGPQGRQNLRAHNLMLFTQIADGIDDETWQYHLERRDYSNWVRESIGDEDLASAVLAVEANVSLGSRDARGGIIAAIRERYTTPA